jgi:AcrR family transcriptional regulator
LPKVSEAHRCNRKRQILDAAIECFARQGFQRTTIEDIIRESDLSAGAIYSYFENKEEIIETLADERHQREERLIEEALRHGEWPQSLRILFKSFYESMAEPNQRKERRLGIHLWSEALCNPRILKMVRRGINQPLKLLSDAIAREQSNGQLPATLNPDATARIFIALFHGLILQQAWDERTDVAAFVKTAQAMVAAYFSSTATAHTAKIRKLAAVEPVR